MHIQTVRRDTTGIVESGSGHNIPAIGDAVRKVLNSLQTLRIAAQAGGDIRALMAADALEAIASAELKGCR